MNEKLFRVQMLMHDDKLRTLAAALGIGKSTLSEKIKGINNQFKQSEIDAIIKRYNLTPDDVQAIFFSNKGGGMERVG